MRNTWLSNARHRRAARTARHLPNEQAALTRRLHSLTGARWFAALAVFLFHGKELFAAVPGAPEAIAMFSGQGRVGVSFFFALSGFVLAWAWSPNVSTGTFYRRRAARILPLCWLTAIFAFLLLAAQNAAGEVAPHVPGSAFSLTLLQAWVPWQRFYFGGNAVEWSLSVEAFFYLLFPFLIPMVRRFTDRGVLVGGLAVATAATAYTAGMQLVPFNPEWTTYVFPPPRLAEFVMGICAAVAVRRGIVRAVPLWVGVILAVGAWQAGAWLPGTLGWGPAVALPFVVLIIAAAQADLTERPSILRHPVVVRLGEWSFAFYLVHAIAIGVVLLVVTPRTVLQGVTAMLVAFVAALAVSAVLYHWVEMPLERKLRGPATARSAART